MTIICDDTSAMGRVLGCNTSRAHFKCILDWDQSKGPICGGGGRCELWDTLSAQCSVRFLELSAVEELRSLSLMLGIAKDARVVDKRFDSCAWFTLVPSRHGPSWLYQHSKYHVVININVRVYRCVRAGGPHEDGHNSGGGAFLYYNVCLPPEFNPFKSHCPCFSGCNVVVIWFIYFIVYIYLFIIIRFIHDYTYWPHTRGAGTRGQWGQLAPTTLEPWGRCPLTFHRAKNRWGSCPPPN